MRVSVAALLAMASSVLAQTADFDAITAPTKDEVIPAGKPYTISWTALPKYSGTVSISLIGGANNLSLVPAGDIAKGVSNTAGSYEWSVSSDLGKDAVYGIQITYDKDTSILQYSPPFHIKGSSSGSSSSSSGSATGYSTSTSTHKTHSGYPTSTGTWTTYSSSSMSMPTYTPSGNLSTTAGPTQVTYTSTSTTSGTSSTSSGPVTVPTGGAGQVAAGSFAVIGGLAMAVLAL